MGLEHDDPLRLLSRLRAARRDAPASGPAHHRRRTGTTPRPRQGPRSRRQRLHHPPGRPERAGRARPHPDQAQAAARRNGLLDNYKRGLTLALTDESHRPAQPPALCRRPSSDGQVRAARPRAERRRLAAHVRPRPLQERERHLGPRHRRRGADRGGQARAGQCPRLRSGGALWREEFVIVLGHVEDMASAIADRLRRAIAERPVVVSSHPGTVPVTISIGVITSVATWAPRPSSSKPPTGRSTPPARRAQPRRGGPRGPQPVGLAA